MWTSYLSVLNSNTSCLSNKGTNCPYEFNQVGTFLPCTDDMLMTMVVGEEEDIMITMVVVEEGGYEDNDRTGGDNWAYGCLWRVIAVYLQLNCSLSVPRVKLGLLKGEQ
jgi:hypothetical protein